MDILFPSDQRQESLCSIHHWYVLSISLKYVQLTDRTLSTGPFNCVGRQLALMEVRFLLAYIIWENEISYAPGEDGRRMREESVDLVILKAGKLDVVFKKREKTGV